jgi:hypothetical protein
MACGTPVVTISTPDCDNAQIELIDNNKTGYVVHRNKRLIAEAVLQLYHNQSLTAEFISNGRCKVEDNFEASKIVKSFEELILSSLDLKITNKLAKNLVFNWDKSMIDEYESRLVNIHGKLNYYEVIYTNIKTLLKKMLRR